MFLRLLDFAPNLEPEALQLVLLVLTHATAAAFHGFAVAAETALAPGSVVISSFIVSS